MNINSLVSASFRHYWRDHLGLLLGSFLASTILSGSLLVGDSVRGSLRRAAELRLGKIEVGLIGGDRWFTEELARETNSAPLIIVRGSATAADGAARANTVQVLGVDKEFWRLSPGARDMQLGKDALAINQDLARKLNVKAGDTLLIRLEKPGVISRDAPLSGEGNQDVTLRRKITAIIGGEDFGDFQLQASQVAPDNVYIPLGELQAAMGKGQNSRMINALFDIHLYNQGLHKWDMVRHSGLESPEARAFATRVYSSSMEGYRSLEDFSLKLTHLAGSPGEWQITTDRVFLDDAIAQKVLQTMPGSRGVLTYLVNGFSSAKGRAPYSFVTASLVEGAESSAVITQWLADDLQLAPGDTFDIRYFTVGLGRGLVERTANFTVSAILPMTDPRVNQSWTPDFPGVSDAKNCRDWQPGIPMKLDAIRPKDEEYWKQYRATPKAFISLSGGQKLWSNRFGKLTSIRFPDTGQDEKGLREQLVNNLRLADIGLVPRNLKQEGSAAARGSVDFGGLFVGMSMFIIASALIFSGLLFIFTIEKRVSQFGVLLAIGWREQQVRASILLEVGLVALLGTTLGLPGGFAYTKLALAGLNGVWSDATAGLKLSFSASPLILVVSFGCSFLATFGVLWLACRKIFKARAKDLLVGEAWADSRGRKALGRVLTSFKSIRRYLPLISLVMAIGLSWAGGRATNPEAIAGMFFGAGFMLLVAGLLVISKWIRSAFVSEHQATNLLQIGVRNVTRRPGRSLAVIGMMAGGIFLVIAVNAFRLGAEADPAARTSGTGGFALIGESTLPVYEDLNSQAALDTFALDERIMHEALVVPFRVREGDDASCLNLNKAQRPLLCAVNPVALGAIPHVPVGGDGKPKPLAEQEVLPSIGDRQPVRFSFAEGSWDRLLDSGGEIVPGIADQATALWGLGKGLGDTIPYTDAQGREFKIKLVGLLSGSVLQGKVIISEQDFLKKYPDSAGCKFFLIATNNPPACTSITNPALDHANVTKSVSAHLTRQLETRGLALEPTVARLAVFNSVQNTYIGIFTVLGGLGVLLGTAGLGVLTLRNVLERRGEFGLMQALGFQRRALQNMVLSEHVVLLGGGLLLGLLCSVIAVWPNVKQSSGGLPLNFLFWLNLGILLFGIIICWFAAAVAVKGKLLDAVRRE